jgi:hypothetical protein
VAPLGQRRIDDVEAVEHPLRLAVSDQEDVHVCRS